ncbi:DUF6968 family protein [Sorangium sp. So ce1024]|uniref:DUF6968 family protein n=1 Tax=Sorangium sp. So ce1024 TaxID=3133327 RepID=UPI003F10F6F5
MSAHTTTRALTRTLQMTQAGSSDIHDVIVRIWLPERDPAPGGDFRALVEIDGFDVPYSRYFYGVDELHAFLAGCWTVPQILKMLAPTGARLTWLGEDDLGFAASSAIP